MTHQVERIDTAAETSAILRRQAESCLRLAQEARPSAVVAELLALVACLEERAVNLTDDGPHADAQREMLRILV